VVYGPPEVEKKRTKTRPSVPIARGSFCLIDQASITTQISAPKYLRKSGSFFGFTGEVEATAKIVFRSFLSGALCRCVTWTSRNVVSKVILSELRVQMSRCG
jgi:hypothetical protein